METKQEWKIGDCLALMQDMPDESIDLIVADPPYYKIDSNEWDNQWKSLDDYIAWLEVRTNEMQRVLKKNGSLYIFGDDHRIAYIQVMLDRKYSFLNHLVWYKRNNQAIKGANQSRRFVSVSERILFYEQQSLNGLPATGLQEIHSTVDCFARIKEYMRDEYKKVMVKQGFITKEECNEYLNGITNTKSVVTRHYFADSQYCFPTAELYAKLQTTGFFRREYEDLRRPFNHLNKMYEVFDIPIINGKDNTDHTTTKPVKLITQLIKSSSNQGDIVLDPFLGSGTTLQACMNTDRHCIGFELEDKWQDVYRNRLRHDVGKISDWF